MRRQSLRLVALCVLSALAYLPVTASAAFSPGTIDTIAGGGALSGEGIPATSAVITPYGVAVNSTGDVFVSDRTTCTVRKISNAVMTTAAGTFCHPSGSNDLGDGGPATLARLGGEVALAFDAVDNLYIADTWDCAVREVRAATGTITTIAGRGPFYCDGSDLFAQNVPATSVNMLFPAGLAVGSDGTVYVSQPDGCIVRKITAGIINPFAGSGPLPGGGPCAFAGDGGLAAAALLNAPRGLAVDSSGNVFIADAGNCRVRRVGAGIITTVAGTGDCYFDPDGPAATTRLDPFGGVAANSAGDVYIADANHCLVRKLHDGNITTVAGSLVFPIPGAPEVYTSICGFGGDAGPATSALLNGPVALAADALGNVLVSDLFNGRVRILYGATPPATSSNASPTLSLPAAQSGHVGAALTFGISASDANADAIVLSAGGLPPGLGFTDHHDGTGSVAGTPTVAGTYHVAFWASDGTIPAPAGTVDVTTALAGSPPTLVAPSSMSVQRNTALTFSIRATDPDGDPITLSASGLPSGASFTDHGDGTGSVSGLVTAPAGMYAATFTATDATSAQATRTVAIIVYNRGAAVDGSGWVLDGGTRADFDLSAKYGPRDRPQGEVQYTYRSGAQTMRLKSKDVEWLLVQGSSAVLHGTATVNGVPGYLFEVTVADGTGSAGDRFAINIWAPDGSLLHAEPSLLLGGGNLSVHAN